MYVEQITKFFFFLHLLRQTVHYIFFFYETTVKGHKCIDTKAER